MTRSAKTIACGVAAMLLAGALPAAAQTAQGVPNALQGFSQNRGEPVKIEAATLEVRDREKIATFTGNVHVLQGDTTLKCDTLVVFYDQEGGPQTKTASAKTASVKPASAPGSGQQQIRRLEAKGGVIVTQKDQIATSDTAVFDMKSNTAVLVKNVVLTQGQNVMRGERLVVDLTTGVSRVEASQDGSGRVQGLLFPGSSPRPEARDKPEAKDPRGDSGRAGAKPAPRAPRTN